MSPGSPRVAESLGAVLRLSGHRSVVSGVAGELLVWQESTIVFSLIAR